MTFYEKAIVIKHGQKKMASLSTNMLQSKPDRLTCISTKHHVCPKDDIKPSTKY